MAFSAISFNFVNNMAVICSGVKVCSSEAYVTCETIMMINLRIFYERESSLINSYFKISHVCLDTMDKFIQNLIQYQNAEKFKSIAHIA